MLNKKLVSLMAASAVVALVGFVPDAHAQMIVPLPPSTIAPMQPQIIAPMQQPPDEVDFYSDEPKAEPGDDPANWSAHQNVVDSRRYEQFVQTNPAFRQARIKKEYGFITEPGLYQQCVGWFGR